MGGSVPLGPGWLGGLGLSFDLGGELADCAEMVSRVDEVGVGFDMHPDVGEIGGPDEIGELGGERFELGDFGLVFVFGGGLLVPSCGPVDFGTLVEERVDPVLEIGVGVDEVGDDGVGVGDDLS